MNSRPPEDTACPPFFTVAASCCNVAPYVRECLDSLVSQLFEDWECVVWAEESTDGTEAILREYAARDPRFSIHTGPRSGGVSASRNKGIEFARGEYILFLDGDDYLSPGCLRRIHDAIAAAPGADIYPCALREFDHDSGETLQTCDTFKALPSTGIPGREAILRLNSSWPNPMLQLSVFRRAFLVEHGLECIPGIRSEDMEFFPRALYFARCVHPLPECHYQYRSRSDSICGQAKNSPPDALYDDRAVVYRFLLAFFARVSEDPGFDPRIGTCWARAWIATQIAYQWFFPPYFREVSRARRTDTLKKLFADGFDSFDRLCRFGDARTRIVGRWIEMFVRHPRLRGIVECLFTLQVAFHDLKERLSGHGTRQGERQK